MLEAITYHIIIDLAVGILLSGILVLFHMATGQLFMVGLSFDLYNRDLYWALVREPMYIIGYATPIAVHFITAAAITAMVSSQINMFDAFIISAIPVATCKVYQASYLKKSERNWQSWVDTNVPKERMDEFLSMIARSSEDSRKGLSRFRSEIINFLILFVGGLTGKLLIALVAF
jgi:hypothetical protein